MSGEPLLKGRGDYRKLLIELFLKEGGLRERMTRMRLEERKQ